MNISNSSGKRHHHHHSHHNAFVSTSGGTIKRTNRHFASLDFLLNIPMQNELKIIEAGLARKKQDEDSRDVHEDGENKESTMLLLGIDEHLNPTADLAGRKLQGASAPVARIPLEFRHSLLKIRETSAVVRQWEDQLLLKGFHSSSSTKSIHQPLLSSRLLFSRARAYPVATMSIIKYDPGEEAKKLSKLKAEDQKGLEVFAVPARDWRGCSYKLLFKPLSETNEYYREHGYMHDPNLLDDPTMLHGSHRYVLGRAAVTGPVVSSIILYVNKKELKENLNSQFHEMHPQLPPSLTLSKIRNIKKAALLACITLEIEVSTVASAVIYFERLCLKSLVTKSNRHLTMSVCLLLAYKLNENFTAKGQQQKLVKLLEFFDREWEISKKDLFGAEFGAFVQLGFSLYVPAMHIHVVYTRLLKLINKTSRAYLGDDMDIVFNQSVIDHEHDRAEFEKDKESV